ncbi:MAG: ABC transporter permease, partial [Verrucomicrobiota bacterium]
ALPDSPSRAGVPPAFSSESKTAARAGALAGQPERPPYVKNLEENLRRNLDPASLGFVFQPAHEQALNASAQSQDFSGLFIGFSFFLIVAALILISLLFQFGLEQRTTEIGTFLALGFRPKQIRRLLLGEGIALAFLGGILGMAGGIFYAKAMLLGLTTLWRDAVGTSALHFHATPMALVGGFIGSLLVSGLTIWLALRNQAKRPAHELLDQGAELEQNVPQNAKSKKWSWWIGIFSLAIAIGLTAFAISKKENADPGIFFGAGALLLIAGLAFTANFLKWLAQLSAAASRQSADSLDESESGALPGRRYENFGTTSIAIRNIARRRKRSLATIGLLACGSFLVVSVAANKLDSEKDSRKRSSGTGGFALIGESTLPITKNLNTEAGRDFFGLSESDLAGVSFVSFRVRDGDDASCLNLNRAQTPRLLGVNPDVLAERKAFSFTKVLRETKTPWLSLQPATVIDAPLQKDDAIPAIGDAASVQWALHKKVGDVIPYTDERGNQFNVRIVATLANSILQGSLIIDEAEFVKRFPSTSGYRMFLIDAPSDQGEYAPSHKIDSASAALSRAMRDYGMELIKTETRLAQFNAVQNTYLNTFQILGGLGLLLGSAGMGIVVLRNVLERRGELAVLLAIGFRRKNLRTLVLSEHAALLFLGIGLGLVSALIAVLPALLSPRGDLPYLTLALTLGAVLLSGLVWTWAATRVALRGELMEALRNN